MAATAVATALWPFCTSLPSIIAFGFAFGTFACAYASIGPMATARLVPVRDLSAAIGLVLGPAMIPGALLASPTAGAVREATGSYAISAYTSAAVFALTAWMLSTVKIDDRKGPPTTTATKAATAAARTPSKATASPYDEDTDQELFQASTAATPPRIVDAETKRETPPRPRPVAVSKMKKMKMEMSIDAGAANDTHDRYAAREVARRAEFGAVSPDEARAVQELMKQGAPPEKLPTTTG